MKEQRATGALRKFHSIPTTFVSFIASLCFIGFARAANFTAQVEVKLLPRLRPPTLCRCRFDSCLCLYVSCSAARQDLPETSWTILKLHIIEAQSEHKVRDWIERLADACSICTCLGCLNSAKTVQLLRTPKCAKGLIHYPCARCFNMFYA
jgi:hypothetical protein